MNKSTLRSLFAVPAAMCLFAANARGGATSFGETAGALPSVRANAMGDAYTAAAGDVFGSYYNPAHQAPKAAGFAFARGYAEDSTGAMAISMPGLPGGFNIGVSLLYYTAGNIDLYGPNGSMGSVNAQRDYLGLLNISRSFGPLSIGLNGKALRTRLFDSKQGDAYLLDAGLLLRTPLLHIGAALQNFGTKMTVGSEPEKIPRTVRFGAYKSLGVGAMEVNLAFDVAKTEKEPSRASGALELTCWKMVALRGGYEFRNALSEANSLRFGFGITLSPLTVDYALVPYKDLGPTHRFALTYRL